MTAAVHALSGAVLAVGIQNPVIGLPVAFASHLVLDAIPHWDFGTNWKKKTKLRLYIEATIDVLIGAAIVYFFFRNSVQPTYLWAMVLSAQLLDWLEAPAWFLNIQLAPFTWAKNIQDVIHRKLDLPWGVVTQIPLVTAAILVVSLLTNSPIKLLSNLFLL